LRYGLAYAHDLRKRQIQPLPPAKPGPACTGQIDQTAESHQPILIADKRSGAVQVSAEDWQAIRETLCLLSVQGMRESIKQGMAASLAKSA